MKTSGVTSFDMESGDVGENCFELRLINWRSNFWRQNPKISNKFAPLALGLATCGQQYLQTPLRR
jgi:hypothetical protein